MTEPKSAEGERLNKLLARLGVASRRGSEPMIREGRVTVSGKPVTDPGYRVMAGEPVTLDGKPLNISEQSLYVKLYKPRGVLTTVKDPFDRDTVMSWLKDIPVRVYPVGRLDRESEGLLLFTNDGNFTYRFTHPRFQIPKTYRVYVTGAIDPEKLHLITRGIVRDGQSYRIISWDIRERTRDWSVVDVVLTEGKKHEIRILFDSLDHPVLRLIRLAMGPIELDGDMLPGQWKQLTGPERRSIERVLEEEPIG